MRLRIALASALALVLALLATLPAGAAFTPTRMRYEGVLRDSSGHPLSGTYDITLRLFDAATGGGEILIDAHTGPMAIQVTDGVFAVELGGGTLGDGSGPGAYAALPTVFQDFRDVFLEVEVGGDTLSPRAQVLAHGFAINAQALGGRRAPAFLDTSALAQVKSGRLGLDDWTSGPGFGFTLRSAGTAALSASLKAATGIGHLGYGDFGIWGEGNAAGAYFYSRNASGSAFAGYGHVGLQADGRTTGAIFSQSGYNGLALVAQDGVGASFYGAGVGQSKAAYRDYGITASGTYPDAAGLFFDPYYTGTARMATGNTGALASGSFQGAEFRDSDGTSASRVGYGSIGIYGIGSRAADPSYGAGGYFEDHSSGGAAWLGRGDVGAAGYGWLGGRFVNAYSLLADAFAATGDTGVSATGRYVAGEHTGHHGASQYNNVAWTPYTEPVTYGNHSVFGFEPKALVQNDPTDAGRSVVYVALEGDEAGTYTRGRARLEDGVATVALDAAFGLATNPDIGLTASVTPRGDAVPLSVERLAGDTLVVRGPAGSDADFDFVVFGLRVGFETHPVVQPRRVEAAPHLASDFPEAGRPGAGSPLARWRGIRTNLGEAEPLDLARSARLVEQARRPGTVAGASPAAGTDQAGAARADAAHDVAAHDDAAHDDAARTDAAPADSSYSVPVRADVRAGDLVAVDPSDPARPFGRAAAGGIAVGFAAAEAIGDGAPTAPLALAGSIVVGRADATVAPIAPGDLLVASDIPGHARRASATPRPGSVVGQALEPLDAGTGTIRVRVITQ